MTVTAVCEILVFKCLCVQLDCGNPTQALEFSPHRLVLGDFSFRILMSESGKALDFMNKKIYLTMDKYKPKVNPMP